MFRKKKSHARNVRHPLIRRPILKNVDDCLCAMARKPHPFMTPLQGLPLFYGPDPGRCPGLSHGAPLGLGRRDSSTASPCCGWEGVIRPRRLPVVAGKARFVAHPLPVGAQEARGAGPVGLRSVVGGSSLAFDEVGESDGSESQEDKGENESCEHGVPINPGRRISSKIVRGKNDGGRFRRSAGGASGR